MKLTTRLFVAAIAVAALVSVRAAAQETTWRGKISDSMCGADAKWGFFGKAQIERV